LNGVSFVLSALLLLRLPGEKLQGALAVSRGHLRDLKDGFARVIRTRPLLTVLVVWTIALGAVASTQTAQVFLAKDSFQAGDFGYGLIFGCIGLGLVVAGPLTDRVGPRWVFGGVGAVLAGAALVAYALARGAEHGVERSAEPEAA